MFLRELTISNLLSFGPEPVTLELQPLNVLIGPNASGKSNLLEVIRLLQAAPTDLSTPFQGTGGIDEWLWKTPNGHASDASISALCFGEFDILEFDVTKQHLEHQLTIRSQDNQLYVVNEKIASLSSDIIPNTTFYSFDGKDLKFDSSGPISYPTSFDREQSILAQVKVLNRYSVITILSEFYRDIRIYRDWSMGRHSGLRVPQDTALRLNFLDENLLNLPLVLSASKRNVRFKEAILHYLKQLNGDIRDYGVDIFGGRGMIYLQEGEITIPAPRLSDGTLRYLCLLAILCHPEPPPLVCIEEPEMGLHPDMLPPLAELLQEASQRMQLIVTTHSDLLVSAFTETPESVVVVEKKEMQTRMRRLEKNELLQWLEGYVQEERLGQAWLDGKLGGTRS